MPRMQGNGVSIGGYGGNYFFIDWQLNWQDIPGNYSNISWQAYFHYQGTDAQLDNGQADLSGLRWNNGGRVRNYGGTFTVRDVLLASGSFNIGHNGDGTQSLGVSGGVNVYQSGRSSGGASWGLPTIPRHATMTGANDFNDEQNPYFTFNNPANTFVDFYLETPNNGGGAFAGRNIGTGGGGGVSITLTSGELNTLRSRMPNSKTMLVRYVIHDTLGGQNSWSFLDRTVTIVNGAPVFTAAQISYEDTNAAAIAVTGDDQIIVQNQSEMDVAFTAATPLKYATISQYRITVNGDQQTRSTAGTLSYPALDVSVDLPILIEAIDSRGFVTAAQITASVAAWLLPRATLQVARVNNYEDDTEVTANVQIDSVNGGNSIQTLEARYRKVGDVSWTTEPLANNTLETIDLDKVFEWDLQIYIEDVFGSTTYNMLIQKGLPILFIDSQKLSIGIGMFPTGDEALEIADSYLAPVIKRIYPVGMLMQTSVNTNPGTLPQFAGTTWTARSTTVVSGVTFYNFQRTG